VSLGFRKTARQSERNHRFIKLQSILFSLALCGAFLAFPAKADAAKSASGATRASSASMPDGNSRVATVAQFNPAATSNNASPASAPAPESLSLFLSGCLSLLAYAGFRRIYNHSQRQKQIH
jgi:hypothetical protein